MFQRVSNTTDPSGPGRASHQVRAPEPGRAPPAHAKIADVDDPVEREADRAAESVMRASAPGTTGAGIPLGAALLAPVPVARAPVPLAPSAPTTANFDGLSGGEPLPLETRQFFEPRFGQPLGHVRLHADAGADETAGGLGAKAFAYGNHIGFRSGRYNPASDEGKLLLAHEIAHVLQQPGGVARKKDPAAPPDDDDTPDVDVQPVLPAAQGSGRLREEARKDLEEALAPDVPETKTRDVVRSAATHIVVGQRVTWYRGDGSLIHTFSLLPGVTIWAPGVYLRDSQDEIRRYVVLKGTRTWIPWHWETGKTSQVKSWISPKDLPVFAQDVNDFGGGPIMIMIPPEQASARRDTQ